MSLTTENTEKSREKQRVTSVMEWFRPSEKMPQAGYYNLVIVNYDYHGETYEFAYRESGRWYTNGYGTYSDDEIVAWAKLPELPKEFGGEVMVLTTENTEKSREKQSGKEPYEAPMFLELALNPRLNKVLASGKMFLIVTETEPYYLDVYRMIRHQEQTQGTWTGSDEQGYVEALEDRIKELDSCLRRNDVGKDTSIVRKEAINGKEK